MEKQHILIARKSCAHSSKSYGMVSEVDPKNRRGCAKDVEASPYHATASRTTRRRAMSHDTGAQCHAVVSTGSHNNVEGWPICTVVVELLISTAQEQTHPW